MRLPGFDHVAWNPETKDFDRVQCELLHLNDVSYSLEQFDRILPTLEIDRWCKRSILELTKSDADDRDIRTLAQYLPGFDPSGKWIKAKCPAHDGESSDSLHIDSLTGGFICQAGCSSSSVYNAAKAFAVANGHRFEVVSTALVARFAFDTELSQNLKESLNLKNGKAPNLFGGELGNLLSIAAGNFNIEALVDSIQHHPDSGCMLMLDELAQFYKSLDMYRGGKGADRQEWLKIWNGYGIKNNRKSSGAIVIPQTSIGILGGIQPETITNMVSGDDSQFDGLWNRFSFVGLPQFKTSAFTETPADLGIELDKVYRSLSEQPHQTHWLSIESKPLWSARAIFFGGDRQ
jgi:hypothetical protein